MSRGIKRVSSATIRDTYERASLQLSLRIDLNRKTYLFPVIYRVFVEDNAFVRGDKPIAYTEPVLFEDNGAVWATDFHLNYYFERPQRLLVEIKEAPDTLLANEIETYPTVTTSEFSLKDAMKSTALSSFPITGDISGELRVRGKIVHEANDFLKMNLSVMNLPKRPGIFRFARKPRPFISILKTNDENEALPIWHNDPADEGANSFSWGQCTIPIAVLCNADPHRTILMEVHDDTTEAGTIHHTNRLIGSVRTNLEAIKNHPNLYTLYLDSHEENVFADEVADVTIQDDDEDSDNEGKKAPPGRPCIVIRHAMVERNCGIMEYIIGGCQISLVPAIDFTESNGILHTLYPKAVNSAQKYNDYEQAILSVGRVLEPYDSDKKYPVYGFGGIPSTSRSRYPDKHCFTLHPPTEEVAGVVGILQAYRDALVSVQPSSPTVFHRVLNTVVDKVAATPFSQDRQHYTILLVLTDDPNSDEDQTKEAIIRASKLPMSIIFLGIGNSDFSKFQAYTDLNLTYHGEKVDRETVSFFSYKELVAQGSVSETILRKIPDQFLRYMKKHGVRPN